MVHRSGWSWGWIAGIAVTFGLVGGAPLEAQSGSSADSPMFRGSATHVGAVSTAGVDNLGGVAWRFETGSAVRSSPALVAGVLYVGSTDGRLYALDADSGSLLWLAAAGASLVSSPAVAADLVFFVDRNNTFHAVSRSSGSPVWRKPTGEDAPLPWGLEGWDYLMASPVPVGDVVLLPSGDGTLYAVESTTGAERWRYDTGARIRSTPAVADQVVYLGSGDGIVHALDLATGEGIWRFRTDGADYDAAEFGFDRRQIQSSPVVLEDMVVVGSRDASLYALDPATGGRIWSFEDGSAWVVSTPAVRGDTIWSARSSSTAVRALSRQSGEELWMVQTGGFVFSSPVVADGTVYIGSGNGSLFALDAATGDTRWEFATGGAVFSTPVVSEGRVYFGSDDGSVYALQSGSGPSPRLAVYWDDEGMDRSNLGGQEAHRRIPDHFARKGYERLDTLAIAQFMEARVRDRTPSVVVFGMDYLPRAITGEPDGLETSLFRRYLDSGGKVLWLSNPPLSVLIDPESGQFIGLDRDRPRRLLGVGHGTWNTDLYPVRITPGGERWGLSQPWMGGPVADAKDVTEVLAHDEQHRPVAWVRNYGGAPGTGFVHLRPSVDGAILEEIRRVAEYGILYGASR